MCTVSWVQQPGGYQLFCNRDEKRTRRIAMPPRMLERGGVRYLAPIDSDSGGTWIAVNEYGMSAVVLNGHPGGLAPRSRGLLPAELIWQPSAVEAILALKQIDLTRFAAFTVVVLEPGGEPVVADWNRQALRIDWAGKARMPLTSSSFDPDGVHRARGARLMELAPEMQRADADALRQLHTTHGAAPNAYSPCMHRVDAETVSFSWINVSSQEVRFLYTPAAPCRQVPAEDLTLPRAA